MTTEKKKQKFYILLSVLILGMFLIVAFTQIHEPDQTRHNQTDLNLSKYYDTEKQVCQSPEINYRNKSQLKACVSNQTTG